MPAAAVASRTPSMAGICGRLVGARGETAVAMEWTEVGWTERVKAEPVVVRAVPSCPR